MSVEKSNDVGNRTCDLIHSINLTKSNYKKVTTNGEPSISNYEKLGQSVTRPNRYRSTQIRYWYTNLRCGKISEDTHSKSGYKSPSCRGVLFLPREETSCKARVFTGDATGSGMRAEIRAKSQNARACFLRVENIRNRRFNNWTCLCLPREAGSYSAGQSRVL